MTNSSTVIKLASGASADDDVYNNYCIGIYDGNAKYNIAPISDYTGSSKKVDLASAFTDRGYGDTVAQAGDVTDSFIILDVSQMILL